MNGLIVRSPWIDKILSGEKPWEIRGHKTNIRGRIALIKAGTGMIFGTVNLYNCSHFPLSMEQLEMTKDKHCIDDLNIIKYKHPFSWGMKEPIKFDIPIPYIHPQGAVIWVNLKGVILCVN